ncbi:MAG TPA: FliH/SctL family protein [Pyrinomonadaceae bacterium]|nr:FliH/SctL family protein [Pyrinomonadaceae bacterium]
MLAKVVKKEAADKIASLKVFDLGAQHNNRKDLQSFVFPNASDLLKTKETQHISEQENHFEIIEENEEVALTALVTEEERARMIEEILHAAQQQADEIIKKAEAYQADVQQAAMEKGLNEARQTFEKEVAERVEAEVSAVRENLVQTIAQISSLEAEITSKIETELLEFSLEIAKKVVGREVTIDREVALTLVKISLAKLHSRTFAQIYLNPQDLAFVDAHRDRLNFQGSIELIADNSVTPGGCLIHTETGDIDARIESQFDEIAHGLLGN